MAVRHNKYNDPSRRVHYVSFPQRSLPQVFMSDKCPDCGDDRMYIPNPLVNTFFCTSYNHSFHYCRVHPNQLNRGAGGSMGELPMCSCLSAEWGSAFH
jgi:hypothetical protein